MEVRRGCLAQLCGVQLCPLPQPQLLARPRCAAAAPPNQQHTQTSANSPPLQELFPKDKKAPRHGHHVLIEYTMLAGVNDSDDDARRLLHLTRNVRCKARRLAGVWACARAAALPAGLASTTARAPETPAHHPSPPPRPPAGQPDCVQPARGHRLPALHPRARAGLPLPAHPGGWVGPPLLSACCVLLAALGRVTHCSKHPQHSPHQRTSVPPPCPRLLAGRPRGDGARLAGRRPDGGLRAAGQPRGRGAAAAAAVAA